MLEAGAQSDHAAELLVHLDLLVGDHEFLEDVLVLGIQQAPEAGVRVVDRVAAELLHEVVVVILEGALRHVSGVDQHASGATMASVSRAPSGPIPTQFFRRRCD